MDKWNINNIKKDSRKKSENVGEIDSACEVNLHDEAYFSFEKRCFTHHIINVTSSHCCSGVLAIICCD